MYQGRTLDQLAAEITRRANAKQDFIADTRRLTMAPGTNPDVLETRLAIDAGTNGGDFAINRHAHGQTARYTKIPFRYYERMLHNSPELLCRNVNHWFQEQPDNRLVRTLDGTFRALLSDSYRIIDNEDIAEMALPILMDIPSMQIASCDVTENRMYIKALFPKIEGEVARGDVVQAGVVISNCEIGGGSIKVEPMIYRLVCLNGMIAGTSVKRRHVGRRHKGFDGDIDAQEIYRDDTKKAIDRALMLKLRDTIQASASEARFEEILRQMQDATHNQITAPDLTKVIDRTQERFGLMDSERGSVLKYLAEGGDLSQYGLLNAITRTSQDAKDYDRATELERAGGEVLTLSPTEWTAIAEAA